MFKNAVVYCFFFVFASLAGVAPSPLGGEAAFSARADDDDDGGGRRRGFSRGGKGFKLPGVPSFINPCSTPLGVVSGFAGVACGGRRRAARARTPAPQRREEIVAAGLRPDDIALLQRRGFEVLASRDSALANGLIARMRAPSGRSLKSALALASGAAPDADFAKNDLYRKTSRETFRTAGVPCGPDCEAFTLTGWRAEVGRCAKGVAIGVIDTGADLSHPSLAGASLIVRTVRRDDKPPSGLQHGTAVVSLLASDAASGVAGLARDARIYLADAFHSEGGADAADAYDIVAAMDWLRSEGVRIINVSLSGPDNAVLETAVRRMIEGGATIIAAAGEPTKGDAAGYPGRYEAVIAVSAVNSRLLPSRLAARGDHIAFSAPGVGVVVAAEGGGLRQVDGTSFAAPFITAAYAAGAKVHPEAREVTDILSKAARDLGAPGHDPIYGWGLVQYTALPRCD
ncbi:MAG: S8 family serine peptidase [Hyphomicrobiales bacterium]|nr:S8 family serine peptidase [Hyphomicrobiales bacterium]